MCECVCTLLVFVEAPRVHEVERFRVLWILIRRGEIDGYQNIELQPSCNIFKEGGLVYDLKVVDDKIAAVFGVCFNPLFLFEGHCQFAAGSFQRLNSCCGRAQVVMGRD